MDSDEEDGRKKLSVKIDRRIDRCRSVCDNIENVLKRIVPLLLLIIFSFFGAFIFHITEEPNEITVRQKAYKDLLNKREALARALDSIYYFNGTSNYAVALRSKRYDQTLKKIKWFEAQVGVEEPDEGTNNTKWGFWGSMFYSMTLYTTIGYGYQYPETSKGQVFTCIYALIGIPLCLLAMIEIGYLFVMTLRRVYTFYLFAVSTCQRKARWRKVKNIIKSDSDDGEFDDEEFEVIPLSERDGDKDLLKFPISILIFTTVGWMLICAGIFMTFEDWTYSRSLYFSFISFTTIGLGDVIPSEFAKMIYTALFILVGLMLVSTTITMIQQKIEALVRKMGQETDEQFRAVITDADGAEDMESDPFGVDMCMKKILYKMPGGTQFIYKFMSRKDVNQLRKNYAQKASLRSKTVQTDMKMLQRGNKLVAVQEMDEDLKSRDDTNSLVMMCDYPI